MNRRGIYFSMLLFLFTAVFYFNGYFVITNLHPEIIRGGLLGERAALVQEIDFAQDRALLYMDIAAEIAQENALEDLMSGRVESGCGEISGVPYWRGREKRQTLQRCVPDVRERVIDRMEQSLGSYARYYPELLTRLPSSYSASAFSDGIRIVGEDVMEVKASRNVKGSVYSESVVSDVGMHVITRGSTVAYDDMELIAEGVLEACTGSDHVSSCVALYLEEEERKARQQGVDYRYPTSECGVQVDDRSVVLCKTYQGRELQVGLYIPSSQQLEFVRADVRGLSLLEENAFVGGEVHLSLWVLSPDASETTVWYCQDACIEVSGRVVDGKIIIEEDTVLESGEFYVRASALGDVVESERSQVFS